MNRLALVSLTIAFFMLSGCHETCQKGPGSAPVATTAQPDPAPTGKTTWPLFGGTPSRNMVNPTDKGIPIDWSIEPGKEKNILWQADLGTKTYGGPIVARGKVYVGTNNKKPRDKKLVDSKGAPLNMSVLMAFDEETGKFLWQNAHPIPEEEVFNEVKDLGLFSTPAVDGDRIYYVLPDCVVVCAHADTGKVLWQYDMRKEFKVMPFHCGNCSPLVVGERVFVVTGNGTDEEGKVAKPDAPSFIALTKKGELAWKSSLPGKNVIEGQWSNPAYGVINGKPQVIFPGGDAVIYSFEPETGKLIWKFNCHPKQARKSVDAIENYIVATPVIHDNKVFVGMGMYPDNPRANKSGYFLCIDAAKTGDVSLGSKDSALVWAYGGIIEPRPKQGRAAIFSRTISTCAIYDGLVYIPEETGYMNCLDAKTGKSQWVHDFKTTIWGSSYYVDGHVYVGTEDGEIVIFQAGNKLKIVAKIDMDEGLNGTPVVAGGVLFVATRTKLYAIARKKS